MSYSIVSALAPPDTPEFIVLTTALAITAGVVSILAGLLIFAPEESLFFANADTVRTGITNRLAAVEQPIRSVLLDLELTSELDVPSAEVLKELDDDLRVAGVQLMLARVRPAVRDLLDRSGVTAAIGADRIYSRVLEGVLMHLSTGDVQVETFLGLSGDALKALQMAVSDMLARAEGNQRVRLEAIQARLSTAIDEAER
jgi:MFS superfamily sulfate permease-like transporter